MTPAFNLPPGVSFTPDPPPAATAASHGFNLPPGVTFTPSAAPESSVLDQTGSGAVQFAGGFNRGLAHGIGMPADLATSALNLGSKGVKAATGIDLGQIEDPIGGGAMWERALGTVLPAAPEPKGRTERIIRGAGEGLGAQVVPGAGVAGAALKTGVRTAEGLFAPLIAPAQAAPKVAAATDALYATAGGAGGATAAEFAAPKNKDLANTIGSLVTPLGFVGLAHGVPAANRLVRPNIADTAAKQLDVRTWEAPKLAQAVADAPPIPGVRYTTADLLDDAPLQATARGVLRSGPELAGQAVQRARDNAAAMREHAAESAPGGNTADIAPVIQGQVDELASQGQRLVNQREDEGLAATAGAQAARDAKVQEAQAAHNAELARIEAGRSAAVNAAHKQAANDAAKAAAARDAAILQAHGEAGAMTSEAGKEAAVREMQTRGETEATEAAARQPVSQALTTPRSSADAATAARADIEAADASDAARATALYKRLDPGAGLQTDQISAGVRNVVRRAVERGQETQLPDIITSGEIFRHEGPQTFERLTGLRSLVDGQARAAMGGPTPNRIQAAYLGEIRDAIDAQLSGKTVERLPAGVIPDQPIDAMVTSYRGRAGETVGPTEPLREMPPDQWDNYRAAQDFYRANRVEKYRQGATGRVMDERGGQPAVAPSDTLNEYTRPGAGQVERAAELQKNFGSRPATVDALHDYMVNELASFSNANGTINTERMQQFIDKHQPVFDAFPELNAKVANIAQLQRDVDGVLAGTEYARGARTDKNAAMDKMAETTGREGVVLAEAIGNQAVRDAEKVGRQRIGETEAEWRARLTQAKAEGGKTVQGVKTEANAEAKAAEAEGNRTLRETRALVAKRLQEINRSAAGLFLNKEPKQAIEAMLGGDKPQAAASEMLDRTAGDANARAGLAQAGWDHAVDRMFSNVSTEGVKPAKAAQFLADNPSLKRIVGAERWEKLEGLAKAADINQRTARAKLDGSNTPQDLRAMAAGMKAPGTKIGTVLAHGLGWATGGMLGPGGAMAGAAVGKAVGDAFARSGAGRAAAVTKLMGDAVLNPDVYKLLIARVTRANERALANRLTTHLATTGARGEIAADEGMPRR